MEELNKYLSDKKNKRPLLFRGGTIISMDPKIGTIVKGDILVVGNKIKAIGIVSEVPSDALIIDITGKIIMPGFIDSHRHTWETVTRGVGGDWSLLDYFKWMIQVLGTKFRPEDVYASNLLAAVESLEHGITTFADWADIGLTTDHIEAAVKGLEDSGVRGRFHYANVYGPSQEWGTTTHVTKMWDQYGSTDGLVSMKMGLDSTRDPAFPDAAAWRFAQDRGIPIATHAGLYGWDHEVWIKRLFHNGFMNENVNYIHTVSITDDDFKRIKDTGGTITIATCSNCNAGQGYPRITPICNHKIPIGLGSDTDMRWNQSMFEIMRTTLGADRAYEHMLAHKDGHLNPINKLRSEHVLQFATMGGAQGMNMADKIGSLTPGKKADMIVINNSDDRNLSHQYNPMAHVVFQGNSEKVDMVLVDGKIVKANGKLVNIDMKKVTDLAKKSRDYIIETVGEEMIYKMLKESSTDPSAVPPIRF
ncbi:amidohydrolase family protein [Flavobacterium sp. '19STA2R22 D10 B1']|uniref:amidohydrolase family protein n=1 Tax=Flavobacterium aerium TaxID=3037261 RepID=UPI00278C505A|nr:amidohydrolase family protein [Flavobacterium sp. '19STA2R22 D10 B1']